MAGFTGVNYGELTVVQAPPDVEVYLIFEGARFGKGKGPAPGAIELITESVAELTHGAHFGWSISDAAVIKISGPRTGDPAFQIHRSPSVGTTWTIPIPTTLDAHMARASDDAYAINSGGGISRTVDSGTTWNEIVAAPGSGTYQVFIISTTHLYIEFMPETDQAHPQIKITANTGGSAADLIHDGRLVGQVAEGMLVVDMAFTEPVDEIIGPWSLKRYVGSTPSDVTGIPDEFFTLVGEENTIVAMYQSRGVACKGNTAILVGRNKIDADTADQGVIYRSTNKGLAFTEIKRWTLAGTTEKFGHIEVGYAGTVDGIWWCGGANDDSLGPGLWRSEDDGLTWTFVNPPDVGLVGLDDSPQIISSGRPEGTSR